MTTSANGSHEKRMAELRGLYYDPADPPRIGKFARDALAYADELAAERDELATKHKIVCECVKVVDGSNESMRRQLGEERAARQAAEIALSQSESERVDALVDLEKAEDRLQAAERVIAVAGIAMAKFDATDEDFDTPSLREALAEYDRGGSAK